MISGSIPPTLRRAAVVVAVLSSCHFACGFAGAIDAPPGNPKSPLSPKESLQWFQLDDGLRIELAAAEPQIVDPVTVRFDEDGRMWVVEYRDYPNGPPEGEKNLSRIKMLEDADGDGFYETAHTFAEHLPFCNGLQPWRGGVIATMAGKIAYLKDTDGDHNADVFETWYTGFAEENPQLRVNHPRFGLDNHIYVANGLRGGSAVDARKPDAKPVSLKGHDLKFDPRTGEYEAIAGNGQFGLTFDDYGNRFICSNRNPLMHVVLEDRYLARNPNYAVPAVVHDVAAAGEASHVYPLVQAWTTSILHAGQYTAACGVDIYRGDALPAEYYGNGFTCEPTGSLVHREIISPLGPTFTSKPAHEGREFLASRDPWFRPVFVEGGPDGALYVCDMYRAVIEHPQFMPEELKNRPDLRHGDDRGRIYRIVPADFKRPTQLRIDSKAGLEGLVGLLDHRNCWWRETAQRLIYERQHPQAARVLTEKAGQFKTPQGRVHALWTLQGLESLKPELLSAALNDADPRVREQAIVCAERGQFKDLGGMAATAIMRNLDDRLAFQVLLTIQPAGDDEKSTVVLPIASRLSADAWMKRAVVLATANSNSVLDDLIKEPLPEKQDAVAMRCELIRELASLHDWNRLKENELLELAIIWGIELRRGNESQQALSLAMFSGWARSLREGMARLPIWETVSGLVNDSRKPIAMRMEACELFAYAPTDTAIETLESVFKDDADLDLRSRALTSLAAHRDPKITMILLSAYAGQTPRFRTQILDALIARPDRAVALLDAVEAGIIKAREIDQARATRLLKSGDATIRARAEKLLAASIPADRTKALEDYKRVLTMTADPRRGREVFKKNCASCHKIGDIGVEVAPSIADLRTKTPEQVLVDVLQPNKAIDNNYVSYTVTTSEGLEIVGIVAADTPGSVTLKLPDGKVTSILKKDIEEMTSNGVSLMPDGLERTIPYQDMADVISFVKNWRYLDGAVPAAPGAPPTQP